MASRIGDRWLSAPLSRSHSPRLPSPPRTAPLWPTTTTTARVCARSSASSSSTRRTTASTTSTAAGRASTGSPPASAPQCRRTRPAAIHVPAAERREPRHAAAVGDSTDSTTATTFKSHSRTRRSDRRAVHPETARRARARRLRRNGVLDPTACPEAARATSCTASTRSSTSSTTASRIATSPAATRRPDMGLYDTRALPDLQVPARPAPPALRHRRPLLPGGVRRLVPGPPVADRRGDADVAERRQHRRRRRPALGARRQRHAEQLPAYMSPPARRSRTSR